MIKNSTHAASLTQLNASMTQFTTSMYDAASSYAASMYDTS